ncbi:MAG: hypothetical protein V4498_04425, partial [candidate division FCPU426 bacterium]
RLYNFCWRMTGSENLSRQLFEESWAELYKKRDAPGTDSGTAVALFAAAATRALSALSGIPPQAAPVARPKSDASSLEWRGARLNEALLGLPIKERAVLLLSFFDSLSLTEAAACMNEREEVLHELASSGLRRLMGALGRDFLGQGDA